MSDIRTPAEVFTDTYGFSDPLLSEPARGALPEVEGHELDALSWKVWERARELGIDPPAVFRAYLRDSEKLEDWLIDNGEPQASHDEMMMAYDRELDDWRDEQ